MRFGGGKDKDHIFRRFFQSFQQGVESVFGEHVNFIDDVYLVFRTAGGIQKLLLQLPDIVHTGVAGSVDFNHIRRYSCCDFRAICAYIAGMSGGTIYAIQALCHDACQRGLSYSAGTGKQIGVGDASGRDRALQNLGYVVLCVYFREALRAIFARKYYVAHTTSTFHSFIKADLGKHFLLDKIPRVAKA